MAYEWPNRGFANQELMKSPAARMGKQKRNRYAKIDVGVQADEWHQPEQSQRSSAAGITTRAGTDCRRLGDGSTDQGHPPQRPLCDGERSRRTQSQVRPCHVDPQL